MRIDEITYASELGMLDWDKIKNLPWKTFDIIDDTTIYRIDVTDLIVFFCHEKSLLGYVAIQNKPIGNHYPLVRIHNLAKIHGLITIIMLSMIHHGYSLIVKNSEELTSDGIKWIAKLLTRGGTYGLKISDSKGNEINPNDLMREWKLARVNFMDQNPAVIGPTSIVIENKNLNGKKLDEWKEQSAKDSILKPNHHFLGDETIW
ncbi:Uncharacterised protein [uncultured archaeon]|nr:Uncharacterised protein [uncultured archaeon]